MSKGSFGQTQGRETYMSRGPHFPFFRVFIDKELDLIATLFGSGNDCCRKNS